MKRDEYGLTTTFIGCDAGRAQAGYKTVAGDCIVRAVALEKKIPDYKTAMKLVQQAGWRLKGEYVNPRTGKRYKSSRQYLKHFTDLMNRLGYKMVTTSNSSGTIDHVPDGCIALLPYHVVFKNHGVIYGTFDSRIIEIGSETVHSDDQVHVSVSRTKSQDGRPIVIMHGGDGHIVLTQAITVQKWFMPKKRL